MALVATNAIYSFSVAGNDMTFTQGSSLPGLTPQESNNVSEFTRSFLEGLYLGMLNLAPAQRTTKMSVAKSSAPITGQPNQLRVSYTVSIDVTVPSESLSVVAE